jgi:protoporphyrinogen oxidase
MLDAKFGPQGPDVAMAWLVARIRQRAGARKATGDRLGYIRGGTGALASTYARRIEAEGVRLLLSTRVSSLRRLDGLWIATITTPDGDAEVTAPRVIACVSGPVLARLVDLPAPYAAAVAAIPYRGIVCVLLELTESLSRHYWVNVTDQLGLGCVGIIEHTNLVEPERYGGRRLVYLAHYVDRSDPAWTATADELVEPVLPAFRSLNPRFREDWIVNATVARDPFAQPVPLAGGPMATLTMEPGLRGLVHASMAHVYPDDRGVSKALALGGRAAQLVVTDLATTRR